MLRSLHIQDFAIIDKLEVEFMPGLNVMTGETGAGKTIVVEALKLVLGGRAQPDSIRAGCERANIAAVFDAEGMSAELIRALEDAGIECKGEIVISRVLGSQGKGRIAVNGVPVTGQILKGLGTHLVDVSSQHEHQLLLDPLWHGSVVDSFGDLEALAAAYREAHAKYSTASRELKELQDNERAAKEKLDFLKFQIDELKSADLKPGEDAAIEAERMRLKNAGALEERARNAEGALYGSEGSAIEIVDGARDLIAQCAQYDAETSKWGEALGRARVEIEEVARDLARYVEQLESNPTRLEELDERLHLIRGLVRKHGGSIEACIAKQGEIAAEMDKVLRYDDMLEEKSETVKEIGAQRRAAAKKWSDARKKAAAQMEKAVRAELSGLGMGKVEFKVDIKARGEEQWDDAGPDSVEFMISTNVGEPIKPIARIASGGELSRVMLALKGALADRARLARTSVFDEVDSGIGGAVAEVVGKKLKDVARARQVICITHLPQVAVHGAHHIRISKRVKGGRTVATLGALSKDERVEEIARMLGGEKITSATIAHAKEMLRNT